MITGFNTDIEHDGVVYHVQTEDKGLDSPLILSLVYSGGAILASKRSRYEDLIAAGFDEGVLTERLKRQHRLICAAINAGRIDDLKRMGGKPELDPALGSEAEPEVLTETTELAPAPEADTMEIVRTAEEGYVDRPHVGDTAPLVLPTTAGGSEPAPEGDDSPFTVHDPRRQSLATNQVQSDGGVRLALLDDEEFRAGLVSTIHVMLEDMSGLTPKALGGVDLSIKILGTAFRPLIYSLKTERNGIASVSATMPSFRSGRAAVLVRAVVKGETVELRRVIHPIE